jgi:hypothetical protein
MVNKRQGKRPRRWHRITFYVRRRGQPRKEISYLSLF